MNPFIVRLGAFLLPLMVTPLGAAEYSSLPEKPWTAQGKVTTPDGKPLPDVEIWVHAGMGSLHRTGVGKSDADGRYSVSFGRGVLSPLGEPNLQVVNVTAHREGLFETNLNRQGQRAGALRSMTASELGFKITPEKLFVPDQPQTIDFVMAPAARVTGRLLGTGSFRRLPPQAYKKNKAGPELVAGYIEQRRSPLGKWRLWLGGKELPPGSSVLASAETDPEGNFVFESVPVGFDWQVQVETHDPRVEPKSPTFRVEKPGEKAFELELLEEAKELRMTPAAAAPPP